ITSKSSKFLESVAKAFSSSAGREGASLYAGKNTLIPGVASLRKTLQHIRLLRRKRTLYSNGCASHDPRLPSGAAFLPRFLAVCRYRSPHHAARLWKGFAGVCGIEAGWSAAVRLPALATRFVSARRYE